MKTSNRALVGFGIGIALLVIVTIILGLTLGKENTPLLSENTPQGVVQRYLLAIQEKNYPVAYGYLSPPDVNDPNYFKESPMSSYDNWVMSAQYTGNSTWKANLGKVNISGTNANVNVIIDSFRPEGPFGNSVYNRTVTFFLKIVGNNWLITSPIDLYWLY
jgi:hypothetical protein